MWTVSTSWKPTTCKFYTDIHERDWVQDVLTARSSSEDSITESIHVKYMHNTVADHSRKVRLLFIEMTLKTQNKWMEYSYFITYLLTYIKKLNRKWPPGCRLPGLVSSWMYCRFFFFNSSFQIQISLNIEPYIIPKNFDYISEFPSRPNTVLAFLLSWSWDDGFLTVYIVNSQNPSSLSAWYQCTECVCTRQEGPWQIVNMWQAGREDRLEF